MARVLLVGYDPETVDYSNPALPPGMSAQKIRAGIALMLKQMTDRGWEGDLCFIRPDETAGQTVERHLASANYDCVVIGAVSACLLRVLRCSRRLSTQSIGALRVPPLPSIRGPKTAPKLRRDGCRSAERKSAQRPRCSAKIRCGGSRASTGPTKPVPPVPPKSGGVHQ
jgi:hypothetical protein